MNEPYVAIDLPPGLSRKGTVYSSRGRWYDGNLVRFFQGDKLPVGGWRRVRDAVGDPLPSVSGTPRALLAFPLDDGSPVSAIGTTSKLYILAGGTLHDVTPAGFVAGSVDGGYGGSGGTYGYSTYGSGLYGTGATTTTFLDATTWQLDTFGQYVAAVDTTNRQLYVWEGDVGTPAATPAGAPSSAQAVVTTPERFLFALGADGVARRVQWPSQETITDWTPTATNTAGAFDLTTNGRLVAGRRTRSETLLWTDADVWAARYIGGTLVYAFQQVGDHCGLIAPNAAVVIDTQALWMGEGSFFVYDGYVKPVPCEVSDYVFGDMNPLQRAKIWAMPVPSYGEVWWFYPSASSTEIDRYVAYSYREKHWTFGRLVRLCGAASGATAHPVMVDASGVLWEHEVGDDRGASVPYLESGPFELGNGERVLQALKLVPDEKTLGDVTATFYTAMNPTDTEAVQGPYPLAQPTDLRFTARQARLRLTEARQTSWRVGTLRVGVRQGGRR